MVYLIITSRTLLWSITSLVSLMIMFVALMNPRWLIGPSQTLKLGNVTYNYELSVGVYTKCGKPMNKEIFDGPSCTTIAVDGFSTDSEVYPNTWKASTFFIALGLTIMAVSVILAFCSFCFQSICKKSIYNIVGAIQALAGAIYILGIMLYPMGWTSTRITKLCTTNASYYYPGNCVIGIGGWLAAGGTILTFCSACFSIMADKSSTNSKVERQISEGQTLICTI